MDVATGVTMQQAAFFEEFGFLVLKGLVRDQIQEITQAFEEVWRDNGDGHGRERHDGSRRSCLVPFIDRHERLSALLDDPRVVAVPKKILGEDFNYATSDGNLYVGDTPFHSNPYPGDLKALKLAFYLDPVTPTTGCLRVIPGSHRFGDHFADTLHEGIAHSRELWGVSQPELPSVALPSEPGDVIVFSHCLKHGSFGGNTRRRLFVINTAEHCPEEKLPHLRDHIGSMARFWNDSYYGEIMLRTATNERMVHLRQILANQDHLPELADRCRREMSEPAQG